MTNKITKKQLMAKARGFTISIDKMDPKQMAINPSGNYGKDYNNLRELTAQLYADLKILLPPAVTMSEYGYTIESYEEINTYCEQIYQLLSEQE